MKSASPDTCLPALSPESLALFQLLVLRETGLDVDVAHMPELASRLAGRLRDLAVPSFTDYYRLLMSPRGHDELLAVVDGVLACETGLFATGFFREPEQFELIRREIAPRWRKQAEQGRRELRLRAWCAGCATGEEAYSLAMVLAAMFPPERGWQLRVLATDLSQAALAQAKQGVWPKAETAAVPTGLRRAYLRDGVGPHADKTAIAASIRALVKFEQINLAGDRLPVGDDFDLILCRQVLPFIFPTVRGRVVTHLVKRLRSQGILFLGRTESPLGSAGAPLTRAAPGIYVRQPASDETNPGAPS